MSVITESLFVLLQPKLIWLVALILPISFKNLMSRDFFFFNFQVLYFFLDPFETLSHHPTADSPFCFREEVQRITDKVFREELTI